MQQRDSYSSRAASDPDLIAALRERKTFLTVEELAEMFSMSSKWVYKHAKKGNLPALHLPGAVRFDPLRVARWLEDRN